MKKFGYKNLIKSIIMEGVSKEDVDNIISARADFLSSVNFESHFTKYFYDLRSVGSFIKSTDDTIDVLIPYRIHRTSLNYQTEEHYKDRVKKALPRIIRASSNIPLKDIVEIKPFDGSIFNEQTSASVVFITLHKLVFHASMSGASATEIQAYCYYTAVNNIDIENILSSILSNIINENDYTRIETTNLYSTVTELTNKIINPIIEEYKSRFKTNTKKQSKEIEQDKDESDKTLDNSDKTLLYKTYKKYSTLEESNIDTIKSDDYDPSTYGVWGKNGNTINMRLDASCLIGTDNNFRKIETVINKSITSINSYIPKVIGSDKMENTDSYALEILKHKFQQMENEQVSDVTIIKEGTTNELDAKQSNNDINTIYIPPSNYTTPNMNDIEELLRVWPIEVLSALAVTTLSSEINWGVDKETFPGKSISSKEIITGLFGGENNFKNALIAFPENNTPLVDSFLAIPSGDNMYKQMKISCKGGKDGKGAPASINGLLELIIDKNTPAILPSDSDDEIESQVLNSMTSKFARDIFNLYPVEITILAMLCSVSSPYEQLQMLSELGERKTLYGEELPSNIISFMNNNSKFTDAIMCILNAQKYDFAQVNVTPTHTNNSLKFDYAIQYPAIFKGKVKFHEPKIGKNSSALKFHIIG